MKIYAMPITTEKNADKAQACRETWLRDVDGYSFYGDRQEADVVRATIDKSYFSHMAKNHYSYIHAPDGYDTYLLTCDDTVVNVPALRRVTIDDGNVYGKIIRSWKPDTTLAYCSGGAGILWTPAALQKYRDSGRVVGECGTIWADVDLGLICRDIGIPMVNVVGFESEPPGITENTTERFEDMITYHHVSPAQMRDIYRRWSV
jgi:hypothetical protein